MRRLKAYKKTVSIVNESAIELYNGLGREKKGFLMESNDKENGRYTFMGVDPQEIIQSDKDSLVITKSDGSREVRKGNPLVRLKEYFDEFEIIKGILKDWGYEIEERHLSVDELMEAGHNGKLQEAWGTGTAAVISPIGELYYKGDKVTVSDFKTGELTQKLYDTLTGIKCRTIADPYGWTVVVD